MRTLLYLTLTALALGCGSSPEAKPAFADEYQEYRYLSELANPTPEQWKRREELAKETGGPKVPGVRWGPTYKESLAADNERTAILDAQDHAKPRRP
jgi:hypothetical protein